MEKQFLQKVKDFTNSVTPNKDKNEAIIVIARDSRVVTQIDGKLNDIGDMLYAIAKNNPVLAELLEAVVDKLNENE